MDGFGLLLGHLVGDYILQNDWMASNKVNQHPGPEPGWKYLPDGSPMIGSEGETLREHAVWVKKRAVWRMGHLACTVHCLLYTLAVWVFSFQWMPWWGLLACFAVHWPVDRWRLARVWMTRVSGQTAFASGILSPWSVIVVDNTFHLLTLYVVAALVGKA